MNTIVKFKSGLAGILALAFVFSVSAGEPVASEPKAPNDVHMALRILASVYADMQSKLPDQLDRLPHENQEFREGSEAMRDAMAQEPVAYKTPVLTALDKAVSDAQHVADVSQGRDVAQTKAAIDQLTASMHALNALFPEALRAEPGTVPAPQHGPRPPAESTRPQ